MFFTVKYGADRSVIFNMNCRNINLLSVIKRKCNCEPEDTIDLSDEFGVVVHLSNNLYEYGSNFLMERGNFILVKVDKEDYGEEQRFIYTPMLEGMENNKEFLEKLNPAPKSAKSRKKGQDDTLSPKGRRLRQAVINSGVRRSSHSGKTPQIKRNSAS